MTAQEQGLFEIAETVRAMTPPGLDFVVILYPKAGPVCARKIAYVTSTKVGAMEDSAMAAAAAFLAVAKSNRAPHDS